MTESSAAHTKRILDLLAHVGQIVSSSKSLDTMLEATVGLIKTVLDIERCSILIVDPVAQVLRLKAASSFPANEWDQVRIRIPDGICGQVAHTGKPILVENMGTSEFANLEQPDRYSTSSFICVPLLIKGRPIGVVNVNNLSDEHRFGREDLDLMTALSGLIALAIDNARLLSISDTTRRQLEMVVEALPQAVFTMDLSHKLTLSNARFVKLLGLNTDVPTEGRYLEEMLPPAILHALTSMQREVLDYGMEVHREVEAQMAAGPPSPLEITMTPLSTEEGAVAELLVTLQDTSLRREISELRRQDELKTRFLSVVSHELRTPLTSIKGAIHILQNPAGGPPSEPACGLTAIISKNTERLIRLVNDLLEMANIENQNLALIRLPENLKTVLEACLDKERAVAESKGVYLHADLVDMTALVDKARLSQAIGYLLDNAIKFTPRGGHVRVNVDANDERIQIHVEDTGCGIAPDAQEKIFGKFFQVQDPLTRSCGGTGIGLFLARAIVEKHGGHLALTSEPQSEGARFTIELPIKGSVVIAG